MSDFTRKTLNRSSYYTVAWLAALPKERAAAEILLDEEHTKPDGFTKHAADANTYTFGMMSRHNVVIVSLPSGEHGTVASADMTGGLRASLPHIRVGLHVGIAAAINGEREEGDGRVTIDRDIRLGDVVVSNPDRANGGIVQYDLYKAKGEIRDLDGSTRVVHVEEAKGFSNAPPTALRSALSALRARHEYADPKIKEFLRSFDRIKNTKNFSYPGARDMANAADPHKSDSYDSDDEDPLRIAISDGKASLRTPKKLKKLRRRTQPEIHYGTIASGNTLFKNKIERDCIIQRLVNNHVEPICFDREAAGIMASFPSLVIKGICDYGDERQNDAWQGYAAATAAAFAKEFLEYLDRDEVVQAPLIPRVETPIERVSDGVDELGQDSWRRHVCNWLSPPASSTNCDTAKALEHAESDSWSLRSQQYRDWNERFIATLWPHELPTCDKTILSSTTIADLQRGSERSIALYSTSSSTTPPSSRSRRCFARFSRRHTPDVVALRST